MKEDLEEELNPKLAALVEYLELTYEEALEISQESPTYFSYDNCDYLILTSKEVDDEIETLVQDEISYIQRTLDNNSNFGFTQYLMVDENAVKEDFDLNAIGSGEWEEIDNLYIFKM